MASSIRRVSEDPKLRPFLSNHFDAQQYIKTVIKDGRSEECFHTIATCIDEVNEEIKGYISRNKESLMSGMQDVALLSERYSLLYSTSQKLQRNVERLKKEALESYDLVKLRTEELERIHSTSMILRQLRQFVNCKAQLDHLLKATNESEGGLKEGLVLNGDIRHLASAAKSLHELEGVLAIPALLEVAFVAQQVKAIQEFGRQLRQLAQEKLLSALREKNQAYVAASLQVFFNLQSLPEIVLLAIDTTVKQTVEISRVAIDLDTLVAAHAELTTATATSSGGGGIGAGLAGTLSNRAVQKKNVTAGASSAVSSAALPNSSQLRVAMREMAHQWGSLVSEQAMQIHVLQRVVAKKEDPNSHVKFVDILRNVHTGTLGGAGAGAAGGHSRLQYLSTGRLLELFWHRLHNALPDIATEKLRAQPLAASRIYPYLRKAAVEAAENLKMMSNRDLSRDALAGMGGSSGAGAALTDALTDTTSTGGADGAMYGSGGDGGIGGQGSSSQVQGMFGSLAWSSGAGVSRMGGMGSGGDHGGLLCALGMGSRRAAVTAHTSQYPPGGANDKETALRRDHRDLIRHSLDETDQDFMSHRANSSNGEEGDGLDERRARRTNRISGIVGAVGMGVFTDGQGRYEISDNQDALLGSHQQDEAAALADLGLVGGLKPLRDRYLAGALSRMTAPVLQMFPEMEGYTAAIPSKRDMQALIKALQSELAMAAVEGDHAGGLLRVVCKEAVKSVQLMVSKVESMVVNTLDAKKIVVQGMAPTAGAPASTAVLNASGRTSPQEHNAQLVALLAQLREALLRMPGQVLAAAAAGNKGLDEDTVATTHKQTVMSKVLRTALACIDEMTGRQLLAPLVDAITGYLKGVLMPLLKEGVAATTTTTANDSSSLQVDCSRAVQQLTKQLPDLSKTYLLSLAKCPAVSAAASELGLRILHLYVTVASLVRPVNESLRLRTAKDMSAIEAAVLASGLSLITTNNDDEQDNRDPRQQHGDQQQRSNPVIEEFRAFRRLLFMDETSDSGNTGSATGGRGSSASASGSPPNRGRLLAMPFVADLRPSTLLGHIASCAPPQLPSPALPESGSPSVPSVPSVQGYVDLLTTVSSHSSNVNNGGNNYHQLRRLSGGDVQFPSVCSLYIDKEAAVDNGSVGMLGEWKLINAEIRSWECLQGSLDVFVQRISVAENAQQKQQMRAWYETLQDIGGYYYSNS